MLSIAIPSGIVATRRSPELSAVSASNVERWTSGAFFARLSKYGQPACLAITVTQAASKPLNAGWLNASFPFHLGSARSFHDFGASSGLILAVLYMIAIRPAPIGYRYPGTIAGFMAGLNLSAVSGT